MEIFKKNILILSAFISFSLLGSSMFDRDSFDFSKYTRIELPNIDKLELSDNKKSNQLFFGTDIKNVINKKFYSYNLIQSFKRGCYPPLNTENDSGIKKVYFTLLDKGNDVIEFSYKQLSIVGKKDDKIKYPDTKIENNSRFISRTYRVLGNTKNSYTMLYDTIITKLVLKGTISPVTTNVIINVPDEKNNIEQIKRKDLFNILDYQIMKLEITDNFEFKIGNAFTEDKEDIVEMTSAELVSKNILISNFKQLKNQLAIGNKLYIAFKYKNNQIAIRFPSYKTFEENIDELITRRDVVFPIFIPFEEPILWISNKVYNDFYKEYGPITSQQYKVYRNKPDIVDILKALSMEEWQTTTQTQGALFYKEIPHNGTPFFTELPTNISLPAITYTDVKLEICDTDLHFSMIEDIKTNDNKTIKQ